MSENGNRMIVIGNGLIGSAAGRQLAEWGHQVTVIGPGEPSDHTNHDGVFSSHYDQGRLCSRMPRDPIWEPINRAAVDNYPVLEERSGIRFHRDVGWLRAIRPTDRERQDLRAWIAAVRANDGMQIEHFGPGDLGWKDRYPMLEFPAGHDVLIEPGPAGYINPRQLLAAQNIIAAQHGAEVVDATVVGVESSDHGVLVTTAEGVDHRADRVLVACGAFTNFNNLLPEPIPLRYKTETTIWADVTPETAAELNNMPGVGYDIQAPDIQAPDIQAPDIQAPDIQAPDIDDIYMAPPIEYPDGVHRIKMGCNTRGETWPETLEEIITWFRSGDSDAQLESMERAIRSQLPKVDFTAIASHRCIVTYTPSGYPTIDAAPGDRHGRLFVAAGGNGGGAQGSDTLGRLAAGLMVDGRWMDGLPRSVFLATNAWGDPGNGPGQKRSKAHERAEAR